MSNKKNGSKIVWDTNGELPKEIEIAKKKIEDAEKEFARDIQNIEADFNSNLVRKSSGQEVVGSQGYQPSFKDKVDASEKSIPKEGVQKTNSSLPTQSSSSSNSSKSSSIDDENRSNKNDNSNAGTNTPSTNFDNNSEKQNYDDSKDIENNGYDPYQSNGSEIENFPETDGRAVEDNKTFDKEDPKEKKDSSLDEDKGLEKKDELKDEKKEGEDTNKTGDKSSEKKNSSEQNPEAPDSSKKPKESESVNNGQSALKNNKKPEGSKDGTDFARRNLEHTKRVQNGKQAETGKPNLALNKRKPAESSPFSNLGNKLKNGVKGLFSGERDSTTSKGIKPGQKVNGQFKDALKNGIKNFLMTHPHIAVLIGIIILILMILVVTSFDEYSGNGSGKGTKCTYDLQGVTSSGSVKLEGLQVELINCDGTASDYTVLETVDFEKYVLGVALAEAGPDAPYEALKSQIIAARSFSLTRNSAMCPGNPDNCFYGYNSTTGKIRLRACEADQVYWDYEKDIYRQDRGNISLYSPEINSGTLWKGALSEERKATLLTVAEDVKGKVLVDSNNEVYYTNYVASITNRFISLANEGKNYEQILAEVYNDSNGFSSGTCSSYGNIDYGDYVLSSDGHEILHQPLDSFLANKGTSKDEFAALIARNVDKAGYGTRAGVVAAAVTLIAELGNNYGVKIPYYWGGGHYDGVVDGVLGYWGSTQCHTYANGQHYNYCGFDCSGFVPWAIKNGGFNIGGMLAGDFQGLSGAKKVSLSSNKAVLEPGDLLESDAHIVLVIGIDETSGQYICAEASGNAYGVLFTKRSYSPSGYWGVKMDGFYDTMQRSK